MSNPYLRSVMLCELGQHAGASNDGGCDASSTFCSGISSDYDYDRHHIDADDVAILDNGETPTSKAEYRKSMTAVRRYCFIASILLCFFSVFAFVWLVPCNEDNICPAIADRLKAHSWLHNYTKIEFKGGVNVVNGARRWEQNLVFLYRGDDFFPEFRPDNSKRNGIISLVGSTGAVAWFDEMSVEPMMIGCHSLDIDLNGQPDCLVVDKYGELSGINPVSGQWYWHSMEHSSHPISDFEFPLILPDLNGDGVGEILMVTNTVTSSKKADQFIEQRNCLRILSGRTGRPIGEGFKVRECDVVGQLQIDSPTRITFNCIRNITKAVRSKTLPELFALITNKSVIGKNWKTTMKYPQPSPYHPEGHQLPKSGPRNVYSLSGRELLMDNRGNCPTNCNVTLILSENRNGKVHILHNFTTSGMYGMMPLQWHLQSNHHSSWKGSSASRITTTGFIIKFWKWNGNFKSNNIHRSSVKKKDSAAFGNEILAKINDGSKASNKIHFKFTKDRVTTSRTLVNLTIPLTTAPAYNSNSRSHKQKLSRVTRKTEGTADLREKIFMSGYKMHSITESVMLILFAGNQTRIENISHSNMIQFCRNERSAVAAVTCQPSLDNQVNSVIIVDIDQDGSQELISFTSSFIRANEVESSTEDWRLVTYVRLLKLQANELSNLHEGTKGLLNVAEAGLTSRIDLKNSSQNYSSNYNTGFFGKTTVTKHKDTNLEKIYIEHH